ncbi:hypothetical protein HZA38_01315 [Candidatus Peregrinibacteria bacterium]|nr:hypothetical protein [Candidatus Peregrinibacteria bacterium]
MGLEKFFRRFHYTQRAEKSDERAFDPSIEGQTLITRRNALLVLGGLVAGFGLGALFNKPKNAVKYRKLDFDEYANEFLTGEFIRAREKSDIIVKVVPEYQRNLERIVITLPPEDPPSIKYSLSDFDHTKEDYRERIFRSYHDLLRNLPEYAEVDLVVEDYNLEEAHKLINRIGVKNKVNFITLPNAQGERNDRVGMWAQDMFEVMEINGEKKILLPMEFHGIDQDGAILQVNGTQRAIPRNAAMQFVFGKGNIQIADFYLKEEI